ncbi:MAG TPA: divergent polysaccharide deacetylase family protein, partial [Alphaproteobacteria bacterium]|nr:divergent polysaccharide deacetylase family protein [Alphaproteobacteria bacterium]
FETALASFVGFDGVNNHMGSKFTAYPEGMEMVADELHERHLFFVDSKTSAKSVAAAVTQQHGVPTIARDVFLDDDMNIEAVRKQLEQTERVARRKGYVIAIGHPHAGTMQALEEWIPEAQSRGFVFVPVHDLVRKETDGD